MSADEIRSLMQRWVKGFSTEGIDSMRSMMAPGYQAHEAAAPPMNAEQHEAFARGFLSAFPDVQVHLEDVVVEGNLATIRWTLTGTHQGDLMGIPPTGKPVRVGGMEQIRVENGKVAELWAQIDQMGLMQQIGAIPAPAERGLTPRRRERNGRFRPLLPVRIARPARDRQ